MVDTWDKYGIYLKKKHNADVQGEYTSSGLSAPPFGSLWHPRTCIGTKTSKSTETNALATQNRKEKNREESALKKKVLS